MVSAAPLIRADARFEVRELLGRGGMGDVYRGWDLELEIDVALKSLRRSLARDEVVLQRFRREAKLARRIKHVNVAPVYDTAVIGDQRFLVMEYVHGKPLSEILRVKSHLPLHVALSVMRQVCSGVHAAHECGVIHRDLKPHNIMIARRDGRAVILDFGIARECSEGSTTEEGILLGSPQYMSYEQLCGEPATLRSDVYALGILLYELTTGVSPFRVPGAVPSVLRALREVPPDPRRLNPKLPTFLAEATIRCLQRDPLGRFDSALALREALSECSVNTSASMTLDASGEAIEIAAAPTALVACPDSPERAELIDRLERLGLATRVVDDGLRAVESALATPPSFALLASGLPGMDGLTACQVLRRNLPVGTCHLLVMLPAEQDEKEAFARQVGADEVIRLPLNVHAVSRLLRRMLQADAADR